MRVEHRHVATPKRLASHLTREIVQALDAAPHPRAQQEPGMVIEGRAEHGWDREHEVAIDHPRMEDLTDLADPVVHIDFGAPQTQGRFTAHRSQVLSLTTLLAAVCDIAHLFRVATRQHLGDQASGVRRLIPRMGVLKRLPVIGKDLLEDTPIPRGFGHYRVAPSEGDMIVTVKRLYHGLAAASTPHRPIHGHPQPPRSSLINESFRDRKNAKSYTLQINVSNSGSESWTGIGVVTSCGAGVLIRQWPYGRNGDVTWKSELLR